MMETLEELDREFACYLSRNGAEEGGQAAKASSGDPEIPPEIGDWLTGCFRLEPDGTVTPVMDLSLDAIEAPSRRGAEAPRQSKPPPKRQALVSSLLLNAAVVLLLLAAVVLGLSIAGSRSVFGLFFYGAPDNGRAVLPWGALVVVRETENICVGDRVYFTDADGAASIRKVAGTGADVYGARHVLLRAEPDDPGALVAAEAAAGLVVGTPAVLGAVFGFVRDWRILSFSVPLAMLLAAVVWKLLAAPRVRRRVALLP